MGGPARTTDDDVFGFFESGPRVGQGGEEWRADGFGRSHTRRRNEADDTRAPPQPATRDTQAQAEALVVEEAEDQPTGFADGPQPRRRVVDGTDDARTSKAATCAPLQPEPRENTQGAGEGDGAGAAKRVRRTSTTSNPQQGAAAKPLPDPPDPPAASEPLAATPNGTLPNGTLPAGASMTNILHRVSINRRAAVLPETTVSEEEVETVNLEELEERERSNAEASSSQEEEEEEEKPVIKRNSLLPRFSMPEKPRCCLLPCRRPRGFRQRDSWRAHTAGQERTNSPT